MNFNIILEEDENGGYNVSVPALDGCFTEGDTIDEALSNAKEAIICYLEGLEKINQIKTTSDFKKYVVREIEVCV